MCSHCKYYAKKYDSTAGRSEIGWCGYPLPLPVIWKIGEAIVRPDDGENCPTFTTKAKEGQ